MKNIKTIALILCLSFVFALTSCDDTKSSANGVSFEQCKGKVTTLMSDMLNCDEYAKIYGLPEESKALTDKLKGTDLSKPSKTLISAVWFLILTLTSRTDTLDNVLFVKSPTKLTE